MRGGYPLALPILSASRPSSPKAQPLRAAGYKKPLRGFVCGGWDPHHALQYASERVWGLPKMRVNLTPLLLLGAALLSPVSALGAPTIAPTPWEFRSPAPDAPLCGAMKRGDTVDTQLLRNRAGKLILIAGHPGWNHAGDPIPVILSIDGGQPVTLSGFPLGNVIPVLVEDVRLGARIKAAHTIDWGLPWGHFTADVDGLGQAFDKLAICPDLVQ